MPSNHPPPRMSVGCEIASVVVMSIRVWKISPPRTVVGVDTASVAAGPEARALDGRWPNTFAAASRMNATKTVVTPRRIQSSRWRPWRSRCRSSRSSASGSSRRSFTT